MERNMAWAQHRRGYSLGSAALRDKDEDLALFKDMGKRDKSPFLRTEVQPLDHTTLSTKFGGLSHPQSAPPAERRGIGAELLNSDADKTDYDWLMTPPGTPLFPSLDADAPLLQHGTLINRSLAAIKTSRPASAAPRSRSPAPSVSKGNPSPSRRPGTPQRSQVPAKQATSASRPATPTPPSRASPQPRPSTPTRTLSRPVTPLGARPATPTRRSPTPATTSSSTRPSTPTLRRSTSSPTGSRTGGSHIRNPSPTRSTASTATSVATSRGLSPARPARGASPAPSSRGRSPSPSLRAPYPVDASDDIPPNLRTSSDRPSSAQRRAVAYGASPGEGHHPLRRTPSPARSVTSSVTRVERVSRGASSDSESSFDTCSQSGVSAYGLVTPERRRMLGHGTGVDYGRSSSLSHKGRRSGSTTSPQLAPSMSKKSFESAAREYHRGQVAAFRPLMTNSSISTFYSSRASGLLRRPLTPSSTCSSSEHGATVAHDSDEDAGSITQWNSATKTSSGAHSPLHLFNKSIHEASSLDANDELSSFFRTPEALHVECRPVPVVSDCKVEDLESPEFVSELNWLNSRNAHELDREYLKDFDGAASPIIKKDSKHGSPGLEKIRDKLRHLKSTVAESHEDTDAASRAALETSIGDHEVTTPVEHQLQGASCEICGHRKRGCQCTGTPTSTSQAQEGPSSSSTVESARTDPDAANTAYAKERDIWYIYRHSSEYEVPVAGFSETKMEIDPPQILAKEVHMRPSPSSVTSSPPTVYIGKREHASRNVQQKENVTAEKASAAPRAYRRVPETGNVNTGGALRGAEYDPGVSATDVERKGRELGATTTTTVSSMPQLQTLQPERAANSQGKQSAQTCSSRDNVGSDSTQHSQLLSAATPCANTGSQSFEGEKKRALGSSEGTGQVELWRDRTFDGGEDAAPVHSNRDLVEEQRFVSSRLVAEEARKQGQAAVCASVEAQGSEDHVSVIPQVKKIIWQEEDLQQFGIPTEAEEFERKEMEFRWEDGKVEDAYFAAECPPHGSVETQRPVAHTHGPTGGKLKTSRADDSGSYFFEPLELVGQKYLLTGEVHIDSALCGAAHFSVESLLIKVQSSGGQVLAVDNPARLISKPQNEINAYAAYEYSHWAEVGARLTFSAHYGRVEENSSSEILFYPREHQVHVIADEKQPRIPEFQGRPGVHAKETVVPVLDGSEIPALNEVLTGGLKSRDMEVTCSDGVAGPLYDTSAGIHPSSGQRHPEPLLKAPDAKSKPEVPAAKTDVPEFVQDENVASHSLDLPQEVVDTHNAAASSSDELTSTTGEHFHYMLGSKSGRRRAEVLNSGAEIPSYAIVKPISLHGVDQSLHSSERLRKEKTPPRNHSREIATKGTPRTDAELAGAVRDTTAKSTSRGDAELAGGVSQSRDTTTKPTILADVELPVGVNQRRDTPSKYTSRADAELAVRGETSTKCTDSELPGAESQSRDTTPKCSPRADSKLADGGSQGRETPTKSPCRADIGPRAEVTVEAPVKEEIVESADSPSPGTTRKHMSSFKFSHKKVTGPSELKRSNTTFSSSSTAKLATQPAMAGSKRTGNNNSSNSNSNSSNSAPVIGKPASPQLNKGRSVRAPSPSRPPANARAAAVAAAPLVAGAYGEVPPEEPSIHSRFSNITVRSGSDTEIFDWGPSSLEETGSRCGSSSGPNAASMAVLSPRASRTQEDMMANGDHVDHDDGDDEDDDQFEMTSPSPQSSGVVIYRNGLESRRPSNASPERLESSAMHPPYLSDRVRLHHGPTSTGRNHYPYNGNNHHNNATNNHLDSSNNGGDNNAGNNGSSSSSNIISNNNNNYAPKQNLDKLSEKLEQLETFGARVLLRNPQQQFLRSPPSHGTSKPSFVGAHPSHSLAGSCRSSRSLGSVRVDVGGPKSAAAAAPWSNKCRCAIL